MMLLTVPGAEGAPGAGAPAPALETAAPAPGGATQDLTLPALPEGGEAPGTEAGTAAEVEGTQAPAAPSQGEELDIQTPLDEILTTGQAGQDPLMRLPRFGANFFRRTPSVFSPLDTTAGDPGYVVGPGDEVRIDLFGAFSPEGAEDAGGNWTVAVARDGSLALPKAGTVRAAGSTLEGLQEKIRNAYGTYYTDFELHVTLGRARAFSVYVAGDVKAPGAYAMPARGTVALALATAGGPNLSGSLRHIRVMRGSKLVGVFDAYDLLLSGDRRGDLPLQDGDVVFVPPVGILAAVTGDVLRPAVYELRSEMSLGSFLQLAGGPTSQQFSGRVQIYRVENAQYRVAFESEADPRALASVRIRHGDVVKFFPITLAASSVTLSGAVASPGSFSIVPGQTRLSEVLRRSGGLLYMAADEGELTRVRATSQGPETQRLTVNFRQALAGDPAADLPLEVNDYLIVRAVPEWRLYTTVRVAGEVRYPGVYTVKPGERLSEVLDRAGGFTTGAFPRGTVFTRASVRQQQERTKNEMVDRMEQELFQQAGNASAQTTGTGDAAEAATSAVQFRNFLQRLRRAPVTGRLVVRMPEDHRLLKGSPYDVELEQGDSVVIPRRMASVQVSGAVYTPLSQVYRPGLSYRQYIAQAGGFTPTADPKRIYVLRADGSALRVTASKKALTIEEGDTIVVPERIEILGKMRQTRDLIDMIYKIAASVVVFK